MNIQRYRVIDGRFENIDFLPCIGGKWVKFDDLPPPKTNEQLAVICEQIEDKIAFEGMDAAVDFLRGQFEI